MKDNTFILIGMSITIPLLIIMLIVSNTLRMYLMFIGVIGILDLFCFLCHRSINDK